MSPHNLAYEHTRTRHGKKVFEVNTKKAHYFGLNWRLLGNYGKRKFENLIVLQNPTDPLAIIYR